MVRTVSTREVAVGLAVIGYCIAVWFGWIAIRVGTLSSWPDQASPRFALTPDSQGSWEPRWEPTIRRDRARTLCLDFDGVADESRPKELDLLVRVIPAEAVSDWSRERADPDGWIRYALASRGVLGIAEPALVRRIEWKIGNVQPATRQFHGRYSVHGDPDSEYPGIWPFFAAVSLFALGISSVVVWLARKSGRPARSSTFDLI